MVHAVVISVLGLIGSGMLPTESFPLNPYFLHRLKRSDPIGNVYDPPLPVFPSKENAPFWYPAPYPFPAKHPLYSRHQRRLPSYDPNNPYLDAMTNSYYPNFGVGLVSMGPTYTGGGINFPTGKALMPSSSFNGTFGYGIGPTHFRTGMQGGPLFPYQNPQFLNTVKNINDANLVHQAAQIQAETRSLTPIIPRGEPAVPAGFMPLHPLHEMEEEELPPDYIQEQVRFQRPQEMRIRQQSRQQAVPNNRRFSFSSP